MPPSRWDVDHGWPGEGGAPKRFGSFVEGAELLDPAFFALSSQEVSIVLQKEKSCAAGLLGDLPLQH